jgi:hypothetical protein
MRSATSLGCDSMTKCEDSISTVVMPARWYPNRSTSGLMVWSLTETDPQAGRVFQAAAVAFSVKAAPASGRWARSRPR